MSSIKIGIIENDLIIAESIVITLQNLGYRATEPARNYEDALSMIKKETPDLLLVDIVLDGEKDGIDLAAAVNKFFGIPFIFLTANSDAATINRAKEVKPYAYLIKPFNQNDLYSSIEIAFSNYNSQIKKTEQPVNIGSDTDSDANLNGYVFIKERELFHKVLISDIAYLESENVYLNIFTDKKKFATRAKLEEFIADYPKANFFRTHRSYAINLKHLETINNGSVTVLGKEVPLQKPNRIDLIRTINSIK